MTTKSLSLGRRAVLAVLLTIGFYGLAILIAAVLLGVVYAEIAVAHRINVRLTVICVAGAAAILWSILPRIKRFRAPGPRLAPAENADLFGQIADVAQRVGQAGPRDVFLVLDVNAGVSEHGGILGLGRRRAMVLGLPLLQLLTVSQFRAVLAHEFGHFDGGDTRLGPWVYRTRSAIIRTIGSLGRDWLAAPFRWYGAMFLRITQAVSRQQEFSADALAARTVGGRPLADGLRRIATGAPAFHSYVTGEFEPVLNAGYCPSMLDGFDCFTGSEEMAREMSLALERELAEGQTDPYDSHPSLKERLAALRYLPSDADAGDSRPALALVGDAAQADRLLTDFVLGDKGRKLKPIAWSDTTEKVYIPYWQRSAARFAAQFQGCTPAAFPSLQRNPGLWVQAISQAAGGKQLEAGQLHEILSGQLGSGLANALVEAGWQADAGPGHPVTLEKDGRKLWPFRDVAELRTGKLSAEAWTAKLTEAGIADLDLGPAATAAARALSAKG